MAGSDVKGTNPVSQANPRPFWSISSDELLSSLQTTAAGLTESEASERLVRFGPNLLKDRKRTDWLTLLISQFKNPLVLILVAAAVLAYIFGDISNPIIILAIVIVSGLLGFWQERGANNAAQHLIALVQVKATVLRNGVPHDIPVEGIVPGDIVALSAGDVIPGDSLILQSKDLFIDEAILAGETSRLRNPPERLRKTREWASGPTVSSWAPMQLAALPVRLS
jgi:P-type Mg2+ transporter